MQARSQLLRRDDAADSMGGHIDLEWLWRLTEQDITFPLWSLSGWSRSKPPGVSRFHWLDPGSYFANSRKTNSELFGRSSLMLRPRRISFRPVTVLVNP